MKSGKIFSDLLLIAVIIFCSLPCSNASAKPIDCESLYWDLRACDKSHTCYDSIQTEYEPPILPKVCDSCLIVQMNRDGTRGEIIGPFCEYIKNKRVEIELTYYSFVSGNAQIDFKFKQFGCLNKSPKLNSLQKHQLGKIVDTLYFLNYNQCLEIKISSNDEQVFPSCWSIYIDSSDIAERKKIQLFLPLLNNEDPLNYEYKRERCRVFIVEDVSLSIDSILTEKIDSIKDDLVEFCQDWGITCDTPEVDKCKYMFGYEGTRYDKHFFARLYVDENCWLPKFAGIPQLWIVFLLTDGYYSENRQDKSTIEEIRRNKFDDLRDSLWKTCEVIYESEELGPQQKKHKEICPICIIPVIVSKHPFVYREDPKDNPFKFWKHLICYTQAYDYFPRGLGEDPVLSFKYMVKQTEMELIEARCGNFSDSNMNIFLRLDPEKLKAGSYDSICYTPRKVELSPSNVNMSTYKEVKGCQDTTIRTQDLLLCNEGAPNLCLTLSKETVLRFQKEQERNFTLLFYDSAKITDTLLVTYDWLNDPNLDLKGRDLELTIPDTFGTLKTGKFIGSSLYSMVQNDRFHKDIVWKDKNPTNRSRQRFFEPEILGNDSRWRVLNVSGAVLTSPEKNVRRFLLFTQSNLFYRPLWGLVLIVSIALFLTSLALIIRLWRETQPRWIPNWTWNIMTGLKEHWYGVSLVEIFVCIALLHIFLPIELWREFQIPVFSFIIIAAVILLVTRSGGAANRVSKEWFTQIFILIWSFMVGLLVRFPQTALSFTHIFQAVLLPVVIAIFFHLIIVAPELPRGPAAQPPPQN
jgi:hypothetical protein